MPAQRISTTQLARMKQHGEKVVMMTAYDYPGAVLVDEAGVDIILVGDTLGMVVLGYETTVSVTVEDILHHAKAVTRGARHALVVADMPFLSYQPGIEDAIRNGGRLLQESGAQAVKLEGGIGVCPQVHALVTAGIPVMGHLGLTPQSVNVFGGYKVQGRDAVSADRLLADAHALEAAGIFALVLECVPVEVAARITRELAVPTIGIGAGAQCDGQVLVLHDLLGITSQVRTASGEPMAPRRFVKEYAQLGSALRNAVAEYAHEVRAGSFPGEEHTFHAHDATQAASRPTRK
jgi:3-methyl-2-oxobutanoate hydroxymethyltransferase